MQPLVEVFASRTQIAKRLLFCILYLIAFEIVKFLVQIIVCFQFIFLLAFKRYSNHLRAFSNRLSTYAYSLLRYSTFNDNRPAFPFADFCEEKDRPADFINFE